MMRDLRLIANWFTNEVRAAGGFIREPQLWVALACGLLLWTLAYQAPYSYRIDIGGSQETLREHDADPFLDEFWGPEPDNLYDNPDITPFRWTQEDSTIRLPGIGGGRWNVEIKATSGRPDGAPVASQWGDGQTTTTVNVQALPLVYWFPAAADAAGDLTLHFATPPFRPLADERTLGFVMYQVEVESIAWRRLPATRQLALLAAAVALIYALSRRLAFAAPHALAIALGLAALAAGLLLRERMAVTLLTPRLAWILAGAYALGVALDAIYRALPLPFERVDRRMPAGLRAGSGLAPAAQDAGSAVVPPKLGEVVSFVAQVPALLPRAATHAVHQPAFVVGLVVLALTLRLGGTLHPHARFSDVGLNRNNLIEFTTGSVYFTEGLPSEAGGGRAPYPPGQYIVFAPAQLLFPSTVDSLNLILKVGNALWDSLVIGIVWYVLRRSGYGERTALLGAALYVLPPPMLKSLSIGELANVFGQGLALPLLALLAIRARGLHPMPAFAAAAVLLGMALLGHLGVTISLFGLLGYLGLVWLIRLETRRAVRALLGAGLLVGSLIALFYYTPFLDVLLKRVSTPAEAESARASVGIAEKLAGQIGTLPVYGVHHLLVAIGAVGVALVALRPRRWPRAGLRPALGSLLIAWWGGTLLSLGLLLFASQGVRWQQFLYPALCLGAAPTLAALWVRGRAGRVAAAILLGFLAWYGLDFWVVQIRDYLHV